MKISTNLPDMGNLIGRSVCVVFVVECKIVFLVIISVMCMILFICDWGVLLPFNLCFNITMVLFMGMFACRFVISDHPNVE